jgi:hypothetical protein
VFSELCKENANCLASTSDQWRPTLILTFEKLKCKLELLIVIILVFFPSHYWIIRFWVSAFVLTQLYDWPPDNFWCTSNPLSLLSFVYNAVYSCGGFTLKERNASTFTVWAYSKEVCSCRTLTSGDAQWKFCTSTQWCFVQDENIQHPGTKGQCLSGHKSKEHVSVHTSLCIRGVLVLSLHCRWKDSQGMPSTCRGEC